MAKLGDVLFKGAVSVLATVSLLGFVSVSLSMSERFGMHRVSRRTHSPAAAAGGGGGAQWRAWRLRSAPFAAACALPQHLPASSEQ